MNNVGQVGIDGTVIYGEIPQTVLDWWNRVVVPTFHQPSRHAMAGVEARQQPKRQRHRASGRDVTARRDGPRH